MNKKYEAVIFDFYGVISSEVAPFWFGEHFPPEEAKRRESENFPPADRGDISLEELTNNLSRVTRMAPREIIDDWLERVYINESLIDLVIKLRENYRTAILSNAVSEFLRTNLKRYDLEKFFDAIVISSEVHMIKPEPRIFEKILNDLGVASERCIFIDDNQVNVDAAQALGFTSLLFQSTEKLRKDLTSLGIKI